MHEEESIELYHKLRKEAKENFGQWAHSPCESWKWDYFKEQLNSDNLKNFRRSLLSAGALNFPDRPVDIKKAWISGIPLKLKLIGLKTILEKLYKLRTYTKIDFTNISDNFVGNPCYYKLGKVYITEASIRNYYYSVAIDRIRSAENFTLNNMLEIGGGFGSLALKLISSPRLHLENYYLIDLPENLALSFYYLKNNGCNVSVASERDGLKESLSSARVVLLPPWMLQKYDFKVDLLINTMSFQHMNLGNLLYYFDNVKRLKIPFLYLVNRNKKKDPEDVEILKYPIFDAYKLASRKAWIFSDNPLLEHLECLFKINV